MSETDSELVDRCRRGDQAAWRELVGLYTRRVFALAYRFSGRVDEAEDLTQEIFVKVYERLGRYQEGQGGLPAWLMTLARHQAIDRYRRHREERRREAGDPERLEAMASAEEGPLRSLEREERAALVHRGLRALPSDLREPVILRDLEGLLYEEIAELLQLPLGTVKSRINRGRLELAKRLAGRVTGRR